MEHSSVLSSGAGLLSATLHFIFIRREIYGNTANILTSTTVSFVYGNKFFCSRPTPCRVSLSCSVILDIHGRNLSDVPRRTSSDIRVVAAWHLLINAAAGPQKTFVCCCLDELNWKLTRKLHFEFPVTRTGYRTSSREEIDINPERGLSGRVLL